MFGKFSYVWLIETWNLQKPLGSYEWLKLMFKECLGIYNITQLEIEEVMLRDNINLQTQIDDAEKMMQETQNHWRAI